MRLLHHTAYELAEIRDRDQLGDDAIHPVRMGWKPRGFWVSVEGEDDWRSWCEAEAYGWDRLRLTYIITLRPDANVLWIRDTDALLAFDKTYGAPISDDLMPRSWASGVDWERVAEDFDGIIIAPYQWDIRLELMWYYTWDCASGCIWRNRAIERFELDPNAPPPPVDVQPAESESSPAP